MLEFFFNINGKKTFLDLFFEKIKGDPQAPQSSMCLFGSF